MLAAVVYFEVNDEVRQQLADLAAAREHLAGIVEECRQAPGLTDGVVF